MRHVAASVPVPSGSPVVGGPFVRLQVAAAAPGRIASRGGSGRGVYVRRRLVALAALILLVTLLSVAVGRIGAEAELADPVAGHVVVEPGQTLWDVAVTTAPAGVDTRQQLAELRELNGLDGSHIRAWTVVLLPAR